ncbi:C6 zinc finger domain-containing protein [Pleurostoma richardsiae]|uniref:C6 zinc finger domain-containing protein n=1 Tax=Pleurostoma richardsiae TaxID=41990 RepID=A0AA38VNS0_9PEZI|nr:C6 zinc finger domain-containing protein [Pleurostoma richardsiae]
MTGGHYHQHHSRPSDPKLYPTVSTNAVHNQRQPYQQYSPEEPSPPYNFGTGNYTTAPHDRFEPPSPKRRRLSARDGARRASEAIITPLPTPAAINEAVITMGPANARRASEGNAAVGPLRIGATGGGSGPAEAPGASVNPAVKSRRVRTGCLTCRERHLKCDEAVPDCMNCRKSNRECKRGVRLNFIDVQVKKPPSIPATAEWAVHFQDESRLIASEYRGGLGRYAHLDQPDASPPGQGDLEHGTQQPHQDIADRQPRDVVPEVVSRSMHPHSAQVRRRNSEAFPAMAARPPTTPLHSVGPLAQRASLASPQEDYRPEGGPHAHAYKTSDTFSVASSLAPPSVATPSSAPSRGPPGPGAPNVPDGLGTPVSEHASGERDCLSTQNEVYYMQVFIEQVAVWMDSMDKDSHFGQVVPFLALKSRMLLSAAIACGVKHLSLVRDPSAEDQAVSYYDTATTLLLRSLQNPDRNMAECAVTAVVLNVYETMSEKPAARMNHIAGARALIRECGWDASAAGIGAACFWLNIGMEVISCLSFNWQTAWDPDQWGLDMTELESMPEPVIPGGGRGDSSGASSSAGNYTNANDTDLNTMSIAGAGDEEIWVHRIFYIVARVANFRASIPRFQGPSPAEEVLRQQARLSEWKHLESLCQKWSVNCPRTMRPCGFLPPASAQRESVFPNVWLIKRAAIIGRLFYHTAMCVLAQIAPISSREPEGTRAMLLQHAHQVCGIVAHTTDRGVASVAIRSMAIAGATLSDPREQEEVIRILERISRETGWRLGKVLTDLRKAWAAAAAPAPAASSASGPAGGGLISGPAMAIQGAAFGVPQQQPHHPPHHHHQQQQQQQQQQQEQQQQYQQRQQQQTRNTGPTLAKANTSMEAPKPWRPPIHPLLVSADFSLPNHPYVGWYEPPNRPTGYDPHHQM